MNLKRKICFVVQTEYHLLITLNQLLTTYHDRGKYEIEIVVRRSKKNNRLRLPLRLEVLNVAYRFWEVDADINKPISTTLKLEISDFLNKDIDSLIFFQEQDPVNLILVHHFATKGIDIHLYQDGFKPYNPLKGLSLDLIKNDIKQKNWIKQSGFEHSGYFSFLVCKKYAHVKGISKIFLTFPEAYVNWNNKIIEKIDITYSSEMVSLMKQVFGWEESLLSHSENVIFYMNQPMHDDGLFEVNLLNDLVDIYPEKEIFIKLHPLTSKLKLENYVKLKSVTLINSLIPAELFISQLKNSLILSVCSTSMFINNESCKFCWIDKLAEKHIHRLQRYNGKNPTSHIKTVKQFKEISF